MVELWVSGPVPPSRGRYAPSPLQGIRKKAHLHLTPEVSNACRPKSFPPWRMGFGLAWLWWENPERMSLAKPSQSCGQGGKTGVLSAVAVQGLSPRRVMGSRIGTLNRFQLLSACSENLMEMTYQKLYLKYLILRHFYWIAIAPRTDEKLNKNIHFISCIILWNALFWMTQNRNLNILYLFVYNICISKWNMYH